MGAADHDLGLAARLAGAGRWDDLRRLLLAETGEPPGSAWFRAHDANDSIDAYLDDLDRARRHAAERTDAALAAGEAAPSLVDEIQYGLIASSIQSLTDSIPEVLVEQLLAAGLWPPRRALAHADRLGKPFSRAVLLNRLLPYLEPAERPAVVDRIIADLGGVVDGVRAKRYVAAAAHLSAGEHGALLVAARAIERPDHRATALAGLARHLTGPVRSAVVAEALELAIDGSAEPVRSETLAALAPHLSPARLERALVAARAIDGAEHRVLALAALAARLPEPDRSDTLREARAAADVLPAGRSRTRAMSCLVPDRIDAALAAAVASPDLDALMRLVPHLRDDQLDAALAAMLSLTWLEWWQPVRRLLERLSTAQFDRVLAAADAVNVPKWRFFLLCDLAPRLPPERMAGLAEQAARFSVRHERSFAWWCLAGQLPDPERRVALTRALADATIDSDYWKVRALDALAGHPKPNRRTAVPAQEFAERAQQLVDADPTPEALRLAIEALRRALPNRRGQDALTAIAALAPTIARVSGPAGPAGVMDAITRVHAWWP